MSIKICIYTLLCSDLLAFQAVFKRMKLHKKGGMDFDRFCVKFVPKPNCILSKVLAPAALDSLDSVLPGSSQAGPGWAAPSYPFLDNVP